MEEPTQFFIGHHETRRELPVTMDLISQAHATNYDMVTSPITTPYFHSRVLSHLSSILSEPSSQQTSSATQISPLTPLDTPLTPDQSISQIIAVTSSWIDIGSPDPLIADLSRQVLKLELAYAAFCGITYVLIHGPKLQPGTDLASFARTILDGIGQGPYMQFYIWFPMIDHSENLIQRIGDLATFARAQYLDDEAEKDEQSLDLFGTWRAWNTIRSMCRYSTRLSVALAMPKLLPPTAIQTRWYSEPVRILTLEGQIFTKNNKGYPVLTRAHQAFITRMIKLKVPPWFLLCDVSPIPTPAVSYGESPTIGRDGHFPTPAEATLHPQSRDPAPHLSYMRNLQTKQPTETPLDRFGSGYQDYLQAPLQPLSVNLESITYEVFEKDPIKYEWYERAVARALHDWIEQGKPTSNPDGRVVVAVVGAGRGPLVSRALKASEDVGVEIDMWALEKNPNAFVLLQRHNQNIWNNRVSLVQSDMRTWRGPVRQSDASQIRKIYNIDPEEDDEDTDTIPPTSTALPKSDSTSFTGSVETDKAYLFATATTQPTYYNVDILISELLGSFADNELSPECLDGVQHLVNPTHGISIPASYTAHLTPIASPKLHADISLNMSSTSTHAAEIPYVVMLNAIDYLSTTTRDLNLQRHSRVPSNEPTSITNPIIKTAWEFTHPNPRLPTPSASTPLSNAHNTRYSTLTFPIENEGVCHGIAGYFETVLYAGVELSTNPTTMDAKSEGMISWFPIYFPLKTPLLFPSRSEAQVSMWRQTDDKKVWYEWIVEVFLHLPDAPGEAKPANKAKNKARADKGRRILVGSSELHSSEKEACLM